MINLTVRSAMPAEGLKDVTALGIGLFTKSTLRILLACAVAASVSGCAMFGSNDKKPPPDRKSVV